MRGKILSLDKLLAVSTAAGIATFGAIVFAPAADQALTAAVSHMAGPSIAAYFANPPMGAPAKLVYRANVPAAKRSGIGHSLNLANYVPYQKERHYYYRFDSFWVYDDPIGLDAS